MDLKCSSAAIRFVCKNSKRDADELGLNMIFLKTSPLKGAFRMMSNTTGKKINDQEITWENLVGRKSL